MDNNAYQILKNFVKEHHGFGGQDFEEHPKIKNLYENTMQEIRQFAGKRVKLYFTASMDYLGYNGEKIGKIKLDKDKIKFYEGKKRVSFYYLDAGLFDGWFATLIPLKIEEAV